MALRGNRTPTAACVLAADSSRELVPQEEGRRGGAGVGLYLQSNFNGENGSKNNIKIKQNLQNKEKQGGDGEGKGESRMGGEVSGCSPERDHTSNHDTRHLNLSTWR